MGKNLYIVVASCSDDAPSQYANFAIAKNPWKAFVLLFTDETILYHLESLNSDEYTKYDIAKPKKFKKLRKKRDKKRSDKKEIKYTTKLLRYAVGKYSNLDNFTQDIMYSGLEEQCSVDIEKVKAKDLISGNFVY